MLFFLCLHASPSVKHQTRQFEQTINIQNAVWLLFIVFSSKSDISTQIVRTSFYVFLEQWFLKRSLLQRENCGSLLKCQTNVVLEFVSDVVCCSFFVLQATKHQMSILTSHQNTKRFLWLFILSLISELSIQFVRTIISFS